MENKLPIFGTFDFETDPFLKNREPMAFLGGMFTGNHHTDFWGIGATRQERNNDCVKKCVDYMMTYPRIWYAHNGGKFDFHLMIPFIPRTRIKKMLCINGRIVQLVFHCGKGERLEFRDSYALIPRGLREWAKDDIDISKLEEDVRQEHRQEITKYHKSDKAYLYEMLESFFTRYGCHLTLASAAFKILHGEFGVKKYNSTEEFDAKFRPYYFAGRVEYYALGYVGKGHTCVDINSSFPYAMTKDHWCGGAHSILSRIPEQNKEQCLIRCEAESRGAFPYRDEDGSVIFPDDGARREFFVTGWEWVAADELGLLVQAKVIQCFCPHEKRNYSEFVNHFSRIKEDAEARGDKGERLFAKLLQNSGYGKFGQDPREHEDVMLCDFRSPPDTSGKWSILKEDPSYGITIYKKPAKIRFHSFNNVCVAASITGLARANLLRARSLCDGVVYCDTDSLIASNVSRLPLGSRLGEWKIEQVFDGDGLWIAGKKLYAGHGHDPAGKLKWKTASKGVRLPHEKIISVALGNEESYGFDAPSYSVRGPLRWTERRINRADKILSRRK